MSEPDVTFFLVSCRYSDSLERTLRSVAGMTEKSGYEIVIVNNGFDSALEPEALRIVAELAPLVPVRIVREPIPGLGPARWTGLHHVRGELIVSVDDDNSVAEDFLAVLRDIRRRHPELAGINPAIVPVFEKQPEPWLAEFGVRCLSYNWLGPESFGTEEEYFHPPLDYEKTRAPGGGMIFHRDVAVLFTKLDQAEPLVSGIEEDTTLYNQLRSLQRPVIRTAKLKVFHFIPASRLEMSYLLRLNFDRMRYGRKMYINWSGNRGPLRGVARFAVNVLRQTGSVLAGRIPFRRFLLELSREAGALSARLGF